MNYSIKDAFIELKMLNESEDDYKIDKKVLAESETFNIASSEGIEELDDFLLNDEEDNIEMIIDVEAEDVEDLKDSYVGSLILQCPTCKTMIYKDEEKVIQSEDEELVNVDEECPHCGDLNGYVIVGQVAPYEETDEEEVQEVDEEPIEDDTVEETEDELEEVTPEETTEVQETEETVENNIDGFEDELKEEPKKESLKIIKKALNESNYRGCDEVRFINHGDWADPELEYNGRTFNYYRIEDALWEMYLEDGGNRRDEDAFNQYVRDNCVRLLDEIIYNEEESEQLEEEKNINIESFTEAKFDEMVKAYVHRIYENVKTYKTTNGNVDDVNNKLTVEGVITFNSGKTTNTKFVFEAVNMRENGKIKFVGLNETFSKSKRAFALYGTIKGSDLIAESLVYNYNTKNQLNESRRISGKVTSKKK